MDEIVEEFYVFDVAMKKGARTFDKKHVMVGLSRLRDLQRKPTAAEVDRANWLYSWDELNMGGAGEIVDEVRHLNLPLLPPPCCPCTCHVSHVTCHMSRVTCHMSHVTCHMSHVTCHMSHVT